VRTVTEDVAVAIVHYRSGGMLLDLLDDLHRQHDVHLTIHVVESGDDGTVAEARRRHPDLRIHEPGRNAGYAAGNNVAFAAADGMPVLVINPDVRVADPGFVRTLVEALRSAPRVAAVAPLIRDDDGRIEYVGSLVDRRRARAVHVDTHVADWPGGHPTRSLTWLDGACLLLDATALREVGGFDERYFLIVEEVDWCLRARDRGWSLLLARDAAVTHRRSSSFGGSTKSAYYAARNEYLLFRTHGQGLWRWHWARRWARTMIGRRHLRSGQSRSAALGVVHALRGRWGPAPEDAP
jgi:N-acetylglucosaminyl-diphospho-decaprenol L-rhamnosyltransferase